METGSGCFLSFGALTQQIQIRFVRQKRSIKRWSAFSLLKFAIMFDMKTQCVIG